MLLEFKSRPKKQNFRKGNSTPIRTLLYSNPLDLDPRVRGPVKVLVPGHLRKAFDLGTNGLAKGVHLVIEIHLIDLRLRHTLVHVVETKLEHGQLFAKCGDIVLLLLLLSGGPRIGGGEMKRQL